MPVVPDKGLSGKCRQGGVQQISGGQLAHDQDSSCGQGALVLPDLRHRVQGNACAEAPRKKGASKCRRRRQRHAPHSPPPGFSRQPWYRTKPVRDCRQKHKAGTQSPCRRSHIEEHTSRVRKKCPCDIISQQSRSCSYTQKDTGMADVIWCHHNDHEHPESIFSRSWPHPTSPYSTARRHQRLSDTGSQRGRGVGSGRNDRGRNNERRIEEAARIQKLYREKRPRAMQQVLEGPSPYCEISQEAIFTHFQAVYGDPSLENVEPFEWPRWDGESEAVIGEALMRPFTAEEVNSRLMRTHNSAPGPDGVTYSDVKRVDPGCRIITAVFNACLRAKSVPESWKQSNTVLVHKKGDKNDLSNWRPLALGDSVPKLFAAVVADRLMAFAVNGNRLSHSQKGFLRHDGCHEHNFLLGQILEDSRTH
ncbi:hypothetical protein ACLKA6_018922 [Drosophila palustris]